MDQELAGAALEQRLVSHLPEGVSVQPLYRPEDDPGNVAAAQRARLLSLLRTGAPGPDRLRWVARSEPAEYGFSPLPALAARLARGARRAARTGDDAGGAPADPLAWLLNHGSLPMPLDRCLDDLAAGVTEAERAGLPGPIVACDATIWHESGATAVHELGFALATGADYWRALLDRGVTPARIAARSRLRFSVGVDFFLEIAKLRAARLLWAKVVAAFGGGVRARRIRIGARTAAWDQTVLDVHVNLLRNTTAALAAVAGGADEIDLRPFDEVTGRPSALGERLARNLHEILAEEFALDRQIDPAGGAWYVESLTTGLARRAWELFQDVERHGGMGAAVAAGYPQELVRRAADEKRALVDTRRRPILGTTAHPDLGESPLPPAARPVRARRPAAGRTIQTFRALRAAAARGATVDRLRQAWARGGGPGPQAPALARWRAAEGFEGIRRAGDGALARTGRRATVYLARMGAPAQHRARAGFSAAFFAIGGWTVIAGGPHATAAEAAEGAAASGAGIAVLCSTDETDPELAPEFARCAKAARPELIVILAGAPGAREAAYRAAGFDGFIHAQANARETLAELQRRSGVAP